MKLDLLKANLLYPYYLRYQFMIAIVLGAWMWAFLVFTEPLCVAEYSDSEKWQCMPYYALLTFFSYLLTVPFQRKLFKRNNEQWKLSYEAVILLMLAGGIYLIGYTFYYWMAAKPYTPLYFFTHLFAPIFVVMIPIVLLARWITGIVNYLSQDALDVQVPVTAQVDKAITLYGENQKELLKIQPENLVSMEAANNYVKINYLEGENIQQVLFRNTLSVYERSLSFLIKTHRSYLVNPTYFLRLKQEDNRFFVVLNVGNTEVPVSKNALNLVKSQFISSQ